ncbi:hypothetical protein QE379_001963 [Sphingomonas sp. SORGH_AS 879]|nr:hypothetical protein [Sphingomonas sp. SORGH_AS_0879]
MPRLSETRLAEMNQASERKPIRPSALVSPICAMPDTRVAKTSGAMIILIRRRNRPVTIAKYLAIVVSCAVAAALPSSSDRLIASPTIRPKTSPMKMYKVSRLAMHPPI